MRIYEGAQRQNYEAVLRSIGSMLDQRGMREVTLAETDDGFVVQGLAVAPGDDRPWSDPSARLEKETFNLGEDDVARFMDESVSRLNGRSPLPAVLAAQAHGFYESAFRAVGAYVDQQHPSDIFFFEQEHQFVMRLLMPTRAGLRHVLVEFTREEIDSMIGSMEAGRA
jgi:hypothetical protein